MSDITGLPDYLCDNCGAVDPAVGQKECQSCELEVVKAQLAAANAKLTPSPDVAGLVALLNVQAAFPQDPRHRQVTLDAADALRSLSAQLAAAQAECEGLRQDAEVGKFIRAHLNHGDMSIRVITDVDKHGIPIDGTELIWTDPEDIDAAIDTAIAARKP